MSKLIQIDKSNNVVLRGFPLKNTYSLFLDYHHLGKRYRQSLKLYITKSRNRTHQDKETIRLAKKIMTNKILELQANYHMEPDFSPKKKDFINFLDGYIKNNKTLKPNSIKKYIALKGHIQAYDNRIIAFMHIDKKWMIGFKEYLMANMKRNTADRYFSSMITLLNIAVNDNSISTNPGNGIKRIGKDKSLPKFLTIEEVKKLDATEMRNKNVKRAFLFACFSGLRLSDVRNLKWRDISKNGRKQYIHYTQIKTSAEENTPLSPQANKYLGRSGKPDSNVFKLPADEPIRRSLKVWAKKSGIDKDISFHWSRHTFGTLLIQSGVDIYTASKLMGHSNPTVTAIYARVLDKGKEDAVKKLPTI